VLCRVAQAAVAVGGIPRGLVLVFGDQGSARIGVDRLAAPQLVWDRAAFQPRVCV